MAFKDIFRPKWKNSNLRIRLAALHELTDPEILIKIIKTDSDSVVRSSAVENLHLSDQSFFTWVANNDKSGRVRASATEKLADPQILAEIAQNDEDSYVRKTAVSKLTDPQILAEIAQNDEDLYVRKTAVSKLTDPQILAEIAQNDEDWSVQVEAATNEHFRALGILKMLIAKGNKNNSYYYELSCREGELKELLSDESILADIARKAGLTKLDAATLKTLNDQKPLLEIALNAKRSIHWGIALSKIDNEEALVSVAISAINEHARLEAVALIERIEAIARIAIEGSDCGATSQCVERLKGNEDLLYNIATNAKSAHLRSHATHYLTRKDLISNIMGTDKDAEVRSTAYHKLYGYPIDSWAKNISGFCKDCGRNVNGSRAIKREIAHGGWAAIFLYCPSCSNEQSPYEGRLRDSSGNDISYQTSSEY